MFRNINGKIVGEIGKEDVTERANRAKKMAKISHTTPIIVDIAEIPENMNGIRTGFPFHKTFSPGCKCLLNWDIVILVF
ncbi:MAG: hypothetical protein QXL77_01250 [Candidatus Bathyarchaeia archaeon]